MFSSLPRWLPWMVVIMLIPGCCYPVREHADLTVCDLAAHPVDLPPPGPAFLERSDYPPREEQLFQTEEKTKPQPSLEPGDKEPIRPTMRLKIPTDLPGANAPLIDLPKDKVQRAAALDRLLPPMPPLGADPQPVPGPNGQPLTLADLQNLALTNSPLLRQAAANVEAAKGAAIQAGAYPNPNFGYESDTVNTGGNAGFQGIFFEQVIKTGGKLKLAEAAATMDWKNADVAFHKAEFDLLTQVRTNYFAVLVAQETVKVTRALVRFTADVYGIQVDQVKYAEAAAYEPMQLRVLANQARAALIQARNRYTAAWKQLAASLGLPAMPPTELAGRVDMPIPHFIYDAALEHVLRAHTDVQTAENNILKARYNLRLAQITPCPDVNLHVAIQEDYTVPPARRTTHNIQMGIPVPLWDHNKGNIIQAQGNLLNVIEGPHQTRDDLTNRLATAFEQYENNRVLLELYRAKILPDQVRTFRGVYGRHQVDKDVSFGDIVTAQQTLVTVITTYVTTLGQTWSSVTAVADLLQTRDLFQVGLQDCVEPVPDLEHLAALPCCHPCSSLPDPKFKEMHGDWPPAAATKETER